MTERTPRPEAKPERVARPPDHTGRVVRDDGVPIVYKVYGDGDPTLLLMPAWSIVSSRFWKGQTAYLARHFRVVTFDGRGAGESGKPAGPEFYVDRHFADDTLAVLDATETENAVLVGLSRGARWALQAAMKAPDRVRGIIAIGPSAGLAGKRNEKERESWSGTGDTGTGWDVYHPSAWLNGRYDEFLRVFFDSMFPEPHSTKPIEDGIGWGHEIGPERLADTETARLAEDDPSFVAELPKISCPMLVIHGDRDSIRPHSEGRALADATGGALVSVVGGGHGLPARDPVQINLLIREFAESLRTRPRVRDRVWTRAVDRPKRLLYLSSPIGLGHARRDLAIARELRELHPGLQIDWLAQHPVTRVLADAGEQVHPASAYLLGEADHIDFEADEHDLHAFQAVRRMDETLVANFMVFDDVVRDRHYDLVIGDEAWEVDYFLHENPELKRFGYAWLTDFVGWLPMPDNGPAEAALTADYNAEMIAQRARYRRVRDRSVFVGDPDDIVPGTFGPGLPSIREWTEQNFDFAGYVTGFDPAEVADRDALRTELGYPLDVPLCVVTVGGSGVGTSLLRRVLDAVPLARRMVDGLRFVIVTGPRIDSRSLPRRRGATVTGYLPGLHRHLAAADLAVVQGGLSTTMELTASRTPFLYVPLRNHFEQNLHVRHRLDRYRAGRCVSYDEAMDPAYLAELIAKHLGTPVASLPVRPGGATRAANLLADLL